MQGMNWSDLGIGLGILETTEQTVEMKKLTVYFNYVTVFTRPTLGRENIDNTEMRQDSL